MSTNRSAQEVPQELIDFTKTTLLELMARWQPYRQTLDAAERNGLLRMGENRQAVALSVRQHLAANPSLMPPFVDGPGFEIDMKNSERVAPICKMVEQFASELGDMLLVTNAEAVDTALSVYAHVKVVAEREASASARAVVDDLGQYFKRGAYRKSEPAG